MCGRTMVDRSGGGISALPRALGAPVLREIAGKLVWHAGRRVVNRLGHGAAGLADWRPIGYPRLVVV